MPNHERERPPKMIEHFTALDLDRTILKSTTFFEKYVVTAVRSYLQKSYELDSDEISVLLDNIIQLEQQSRGQAYDFVAELNTILSTQVDGAPEIDFTVLADLIYERNAAEMKSFTEDIFADGAADLIMALEREPNSDWAFYTTGGEQTQALKLQVVRRILKERYGIDGVKAQIITTEHKADDVSGWYDARNQAFCIPSELSDERVIARHIRIIDDKEKNTRLTDATVEGAKEIELIHVKRAEDPAVGGMLLSEVVKRVQPAA